MKTFVNLPLRPPNGLAARTREALLAPQRLAAACRILAFPSKLNQLRSMKFMDQYFREQKKRDTFFFLTHEFYLSRYFTLAQRIDCAIAHYRFEAQSRTDAYHQAVYQSTQGLMLWHQVIDGVRFAITVRATEDTRHEGDLSVCCYVNDSCVCRLAFSYVDQSIFGLPSLCAIFVTRNQTYQGEELQLFRRAFKQNSPPYFCVAAVSGIAMANGMNAIFMVKADAQIAYSEKYAKGFRNSYSALWLRLGAQEIESRHAYSMAIPLPLAPLTDVSHRGRAIARRRNWLEIALCARRTMLAHSLSHDSPPIGEGASEMLAALDIQAPGIASPRRNTGSFAANEFAEQYPAWNLAKSAPVDRREEQGIRRPIAIPSAD